MKHVRKGAPFLLPLLLFFAALYSFFPLFSEPADVSGITALAPLEEVVSGQQELVGVAVASDGTIYFSDRTAGIVYRLLPVGTPTAAVSGLNRPAGLALDSQERLLVAEEKGGRILRLEPNGFLTELAAGIKTPRWIAVAPDGSLYVSAHDLSTLVGPDETEGRQILRLVPGVSFTVVASGIRRLEGLTLVNGHLIVASKGLEGEAESAGTLLRYPILEDGSFGAPVRWVDTGLKQPVGLVSDRLKALYVSSKELLVESDTNKRAIGKVHPNAHLSSFAEHLTDPQGLVLGPDGSLYLADGKAGRLLRFVAPPPPVLTVPPFTNQNPLPLTGTAEANSRVDAFVTDSTNPTNSITLLTQDGSFSLVLNLLSNAQNFLDVFTTTHSGDGLTSAPAEFEIIHDNVAPLIASLQPANGSFLNNPRPLIRADFSDNLSRVDVSKVTIRLDGFDVTLQAQVTASGFTLDLFNCLKISNCPLPEGPHTVFVSILDHAGKSASASTTFTVDVTAPLIVNLTPAHGSVVTTDTPTISAQLQDTFGINLASVRIFLDGADVTSQAALTTFGFTLQPLNPLSQGQHTVSVTISDLAGNLASASSTFTVSLGPQLSPIGDKVVNLGETLTFTVTATNPGGGAANLFVSPLPLPTGASFNATTGEFRFTPNTTQAGSFQLTFSAVSGSQTVSETITITVPQPPPGGLTGVRGRVENLNDTPLGNVKVTLKATGHTTFSTNDGFFTLTGVPSGRQELIINGREANLGVFAILAVPVDLIEGVLNNLPSDITLPDVEVEAEVQVSPVFNTVVSNPSVPGVALAITGGTAKNSDGTDFTGKLSINPVPDYGRPESRPEELRPGMAITIQPAGVRFNPPARLTFPNADNMPPGSELNLWSLSPDTGTFSIVGKMLVSADGREIITVEGGVTASAWHFPLPSSSTPADSTSGSRHCSGGNCPTSSEVNMEEGSLFLSHSLPSYRSLGQSRSLSLTYSSVTADVRPIISLNTTLSVRAAVPNTFSTRLEVGGVQQGGEIFTDTRSLPEDRDSTSRISAQFDASNLPTGRYPYRATIFSNYQNSSIGGITNGNIIVLNRKTSPFGSGWALTELQQLHIQTDGSVLLTAGGGIALHFSGGPDNFTSPPGEFSNLIRNADSTYSRTLKDGTRVSFNAQGFQTSVADRNGNGTSYTYDTSGRLLTITDPAGLVTSFTYSGDKLQKITDPAGRETIFQHDSSGNLTRITNPDGSFASYAYDAKGHVTQATDERGNTTQYVYDFAGRFSQSTKPNGETRALTSSKLQGLADVSGGQGTPTNPAPVVQSQNATSSLTDGKGNTTTFTLNALGQIASQTDALGNTTLIERDSNGNPTKITRPNGAVVTMSYDARGNLLSSTDPVGATTTFTYEPNFNQVTSIRDPKGNTTAINYDLKGNPIEIVDALGTRTQMSYDARGLLTSVVSAVGKPEQNTTSLTYNARGNIETTTDPKGNITTLVYDSAGNVFRSTDGEGRVTEFTYDGFNRLMFVLDPDLKITSYAYDAKGNLVEVLDAKTQRTTFIYDPLDRLISATNSLGLTETFVYDSNGNLTSTINRNGQTITFNYDALNRLTSKTRPPTSTEVGLQATNFSYDSVGNLVAVVNPVIGVFNQYNLANRLISSFSSTEAAVSGVAVEINSDTTIDANNFQFEGRTLQVNGKTLTVNGSHTFANLILTNGAVLTHNPTTAINVGKVDLKIIGALQIDATSRIDVTGRGFLGGFKAGNPFGRNGMTLGFQSGSTGKSGGSYGGLGGVFTGAANGVYGDFRDPNEPGSGGGVNFTSSFGLGGNGGGLIRIVAQTLNLDGVIKADGEAAGGSFDSGGGSGGGIRLDVGTLQGTGQITANGGSGGPSSGGGPGGGGGRAAVYYENLVGFNPAQVTAFGGAGSSGQPNGGAGTIYLQGPGKESGELVIDNNNVSAPSLSTPLIQALLGQINLTHLRVRRGAKGRVEALFNVEGTLEISSGSELAFVTSRLSASTMEVTASSVITHLFTTSNAFFKVDLSASTLTIDATSRIDVTGRGFLGGFKAGNPFGRNGMTLGFQSGSTGKSGGSSGGLGGVSTGSPNAVYGDFRNPDEPGSGGAVNFGSSFGLGGNGGGLIRIVAQTLNLDGVIKADGEAAGGSFDSGGGSGGGIRLDVGTIQGTGQITANGGSGGPSSGGGPGGGGGRATVYYENLVGFNPAQVTAFGGAGSSGQPNGGAGTIYLQGPARENGEMVIDNNNLTAASLSTAIPNPIGGTVSLTNLRVLRGGRIRLNSILNLTGTLEINGGGEFISTNRTVAGTVSLVNNGLVTHIPTTASASFKVDLVANNLTVDATSKVDVSARGFLGGFKPGNPFGRTGMTIGFQAGSTGKSGGSYGGVGGASKGTPNPLYGNATDPNEPGSGGGVNFDSSFGLGGNGGGLIRIVTQTLQLDGVIRADGEAAGGSFDSGGGSGGGIRLDVGTLQGTGQITANGGSGGPSSGGGPGGGGGRAAVYYQTVSGFDLSKITALGGVGGSGQPNGQNGTVFTQQTLAMWTPSDGEPPVMMAAVQLASLALPVVELRLDAGPVKVPDFKELIEKMQAQIPQIERPKRRVFSPDSLLETQNSRRETLLPVASRGSTAFVPSSGRGELAEVLTPSSENRVSELSPTAHDSRARATSASDDFDPIYTYDLNGNRTSMIDPTGITNYTYDALNRLTSITNNRGLTTTFTYDALGRRTSMTHGNGVQTTYTYDAASQLTRLAHQLGATTVNSFDYTYDKVGNRKTKTTPAGTHSYTYDVLNRLVEAINSPLPSNPLETYIYDSVGNRVNSNQNGGSTFNTANQLLEDANFTYQYDNNGNLTRKTSKTPGPFTSYEYDAENKLVRVVTNGTTVNYKYDGLGRRVEKEINDGATTKVTRFIYDNEDILLELDGSNNITARYTHGPGIDEPLVMEKGGASFFYHADGLGSITELTNQSGTVVQAYTYSSFGKIESQLDPNFIQPYNFTAREFDPETELYHYRERQYDWKTGRFTTEDPIGFDGGDNFYVYVGNNATNFNDPFGLFLLPINLIPSNTPGFNLPVPSPENSAISLPPIPYGNYGGKGWTGGYTGTRAPIDSLDECFKGHDECWGVVQSGGAKGPCGGAGLTKKSCDKRLIDCMRKLPADPSQWKRPAPIPPWANVYRYYADWYFR